MRIPPEHMGTIRWPPKSLSALFQALGLAYYTIQGGVTHLDHGTNVIDRQMIVVTRKTVSAHAPIPCDGPRRPVGVPDSFSCGNAFDLTILN